MSGFRAVVPRGPLTLVLAAGLAAAGIIHCLRTPEHLAMSALFGTGFLAAGVLQLGMAGLAFVRPSRMLCAAVMATTVVLSSMYAYNVLVGLPFHDEVGVAAGVGTVHSEADADGHGRAAQNDHAREAGGRHERAAQADHHEEGLVLGNGEPVEASGALVQVAQLTAAAVALALLQRTSGRAS